MPLAFGDKTWLHVIEPHDARSLIQRAKDQGTPFMGVKSLNFGLLLETQEISPQTMRVARAYTPQYDNSEDILNWTDAFMQQRAGEIVQWVFDHSNAQERAAVHYWELLNEIDPLGGDLGLEADHAWAQFGALCKYLCEAATARSLHILTPAFNYGTPEWSQMQAFVSSGVFRAMKLGGHGLSLHEGVHPDSSDPLAFGPIPGAPSVPGAGPTVFRYRYLYEGLLRPQRLVVPLLISELYLGGGFGVEALPRLVFYDKQVRADGYVLGHALFTLDPSADWINQNYIGLLGSDEYFAYKRAEFSVANPPLDLDPAPAAGFTHFTTARLLNVRQFPWAGFHTPLVVRQLSQNTPVRVFGTYQDHDMRVGWSCISDHGDEWVRSDFLRPA